MADIEEFIGVMGNCLSRPNGSTRVRRPLRSTAQRSLAGSLARSSAARRLRSTTRVTETRRPLPPVVSARLGDMANLQVDRSATNNGFAWRSKQPRRFRLLLATGLAALLLNGCSASSSDTLGALGTDASGPVLNDVAAGPVAMAAASSEAALAAQRAAAGETLKALTVTFTEPAAEAGAAKADLGGAVCPSPGNVAESAPFALAFAAAKGSAVSLFSATTEGTYEGPGSYSATFAWTGAAGAKTATGTLFMYDDELSGEFAVEGADPLAGTWECEFNK